MLQVIKRRLTPKLTRPRIAAFVSRYATDGKTLDVGCHEGPYKKWFPNTVGFDIRPGKGVDVVGDIHDMPFGEGEFDAILCTEVLEHCRDPRTAVGEMLRVLKPGGRVILTTRFMYPSHGQPWDYYRFSRNALLDLFAKWDIEALERESRPFSTIGILLQRIDYQCDVRGGVVTRTFLELLARLCMRLDWLILREYNEPTRDQIVPEGVFATGYHLAAVHPARADHSRRVSTSRGVEEENEE